MVYTEVYSMNSLSCSARYPPRSLGPQDLKKEDNEDKNDATKDKRSTPSELSFKQTVPDKPDTIRPITSEEEPNLTQILRNKRASHLLESTGAHSARNFT